MQAVITTAIVIKNMNHMHVHCKLESDANIDIIFISQHPLSNKRYFIFRKINIYLHHVI